MLAWLAVVIVQLRFFEYIELNPQGVRIHGFRGATVPWLSVGAVDYVPQLGGMGHLKIQELTAKRRRRLTAPRVVLGMGKDETERARDLIERWRLAQCGPDPVPAAHPAPVPPVVDLDLA